MEECKCGKWTLNISYAIHRWHKPRDVWPSPHSEWRRSHPDYSLVERQQAARMTDTLYLQSVLCSNCTELILHPSGPVNNEVFFFFLHTRKSTQDNQNYLFFTYLINNEKVRQRNNSIPSIVPLPRKWKANPDWVGVWGRQRKRED